MGSAAGLRCIGEIVRGATVPVVVVVSAFGGVTDQLLRMAQVAMSQGGEGGDKVWQDEFEQLQGRHYGAIEDSVLAQRREAACAEVEPLLGELHTLLQGVELLGEVSARSEALIVSYGERLSSIIVHHMLQGSRLVDSRAVFKTRPYFGRHIVDFPATSALIREVVSVGFVSSACCRVTVMGGFIASDLDSGRVTNLGRGGSDYTAAILASVLGAKLLEIYTDVDGFMTADPRVVPAARLVGAMTYVNAMELCNMGAKVLYAPTIFPAYNSNVPIVVRNTFNAACAGTFIDSHCGAGSDVVVGVSSMSGVTLLTVRGSQVEVGAGGGAAGSRRFGFRLFRALSRAGVSPLMEVVTAEGDLRLALGSAAQQLLVRQVIDAEFAQEIAMGQISGVELRDGLACVALVGNNLSRTTVESLFSVLAEQEVMPVEVGTLSEGGVCLIVEQQQLVCSLRMAHALFFEQQHLHRRVVVRGSDELVEYIRGRNEELVARLNVRFEVEAVDAATSVLDVEGDFRDVIFVDAAVWDPLAASCYESVVRRGGRVLGYNAAVGLFNDGSNVESEMVDVSGALGVTENVGRALRGFVVVGDRVCGVRAVLPGWCSNANDSDDFAMRYIEAQTELLRFWAGGCLNVEVVHSTSPADFKVEVYSERFNQYPLCVWTQKIGHNTIYEALLKLI